MAKSRGIRRVIELAVDAASARRMRQDAQRALDQGTDPARAKRNLREVEGSFGRMTGGVRQLGAALVGIFAVERIVTFVRSMWELGSAIEETGSKFRTTFGREGSARVQAWIDQFGTLLGLSDRAAQDMASTAGAIAQGMDATKQESADFSMRILQLAGDLQSFHNVPIAETFEDIRSGIVGQSEPMMKFGIVITAADAKLRALRDTGKTQEKQLTALELAQARLNLMYERAGVAVGDAARTQDSAANKARNLASEYENLRGQLAVGLLPVFASVIDYLSTNKDRLTANAQSAAAFALTVSGVLAGAFNSLASTISGPVLVAWGSLQVAMGTTMTIVNSLIEGFAQLGNMVGVVSDASYQAARARRLVSTAQIREGYQNVMGGANTWWQGMSGGAWRSGYQGVQDMFTPAPGEFVWEPDKPKPEGGEPRDTAGTAAAANRAAAALRDLNAAAFEARFGGLGALFDTAVRLQGQIQSLSQDIATLGSRAPASATQLLDQRKAQLEQVITALETMEAARRTPTFGGVGPAVVNTDLVTENAATRFIEAERRKQEEIEKTANAWLNAHQAMEAMAHTAAGGMAQAWEDAFGILFEEGAHLQSFMEALGQGMAKALLSGLAQYASVKVAENIAAGFESLAKAAALMAKGPAGVVLAGYAKKAATGHFLAAAKWAVAGGAAGAAGASIGGGGGGGGSQRDAGLDTAKNAEMRGPEVHVYVDGIDPHNTQHHKLLYGTMENARKRFGDNSRITIHPRGQR